MARFEFPLYLDKKITWIQQQPDSDRKYRQKLLTASSHVEPSGVHG